MKLITNMISITNCTKVYLSDVNSFLMSKKKLVKYKIFFICWIENTIKRFFRKREIYLNVTNTFYSFHVKSDEWEEIYLYKEWMKGIRKDDIEWFYKWKDDKKEITSVDISATFVNLEKETIDDLRKWNFRMIF